MTAHSPATTTHGATGTHGATEAPSSAHGAFPPFASDTFASQLLWFAITFGLLYYLMSKVALPRVAAVLEDRRQKLAQDLEEAHRLKAQSEATAQAHEKALAEARGRAKGIAQETRNKLTAESEARRKVVEAELAGKLAEAEATIRTRTADAMSNVR